VGPGAALMTGLVCGLAGQVVVANPVGMSVGNGSVQTSQNGSQLNVFASHNAVINWQNFNIGRGETTRFIQPSSVSVVWNRILDANPSQIMGNLSANGYVVLFNQNGFYFGPNSVVNVGGLAVTTATPPPGPGGMSGMWQFNGAPPLASIVNYGEVKASAGGSIFLLAERVENRGTIVAPAGEVRLEAGKEVMICERPDGRGISASVRLPAGSVDNSGKILADAGKVALHAQVVNQNGLLQADSVRQQNGVIELVAVGAVNLGKDSIIKAEGGSEEPSPGGKISVKSAGVFADAVGSQVSVKGGQNGGNGGSIEISGSSVAPVQSKLEGGARPGWKSGSLLFDPTDILVSSNPDSSGDPPSTLRLAVDSAFYDFSSISLEATRDITIDRQTTWDLNASTGHSDPGSLLKLEAGRHIVFNDNSLIRSAANWSVELRAGVDFNDSNRAIKKGVGGIYLNGINPDAPTANSIGDGSIETANGSISLEAGHEVLLQAGYIRTTAGGNISVKSGDGDIYAGTVQSGFNNSGYTFGPRGATVAISGGIGTTAGGNVEIDAGRDVDASGALVGAYGRQAGDVTINAGRNVYGNFGLRNGKGIITAGVSLHNDNTTLEADEIVSADGNIGSDTAPVTLSLISGSWKAFAGHDITLNEVFNPNGSLNQSRMSTGARIKFQYDYAPDAGIDLAAGNGVSLLGTAPTHNTDNPNRLPIYPPQLEIHAGAGGITLGNDTLLYPSSLGRLLLSTTDGGPFRSLPGQFYELVMSDSGSLDYTLFQSDHATTPLHLSTAADPVQIAISGSIENLYLSMPKQARISAGRNALNFSYDGQNLTADDVTSISVGGDIRNRSNRTFVTLSEDPNPLFFDHAWSANTDLLGKLTYDPLTRRLGFINKMQPGDLDALLNAKIRAVDEFGRFLTDASGNPVYADTVLTRDTAALHKLFDDSQDIPTTPLAYNGIQVGGPGKMEVSGGNLDLGISAGVRSVGALLNPFLGAISLQGASIGVDLTGNLDMTSSQIASFNGGSIDVKSGGNVNVGSREEFTSDDTPKGIYSGHGGDVSVVAHGNVNINGSRIASYDGGNLNVVSETGMIDAGSGAKGFFSVATAGEIDPLTGLPAIRNDRFFGSGIIATTRTDSDVKVGNINIKAGTDVQANSGGVLQLAFNNADQRNAVVSLEAGRDIVANQSGVLGGNVNLKAGGNISGLIVARQNIGIEGRNVNVTALASGGVSVKASENVSGTIVGAGNVSVSGSEVSAAVISTGGNASTSGDASAAKVGAFNSVAAPTAQQTTQDADKTVAAKKPMVEDEDEKKKRTAGPVLSKTSGRVTVILPPK